MRKRAQRAAAALNKPPLSEEEMAAKQAEKVAKKRQKAENQNSTKRETRAKYNALIAAGIPKVPGMSQTPSQKVIDAMIQSAAGNKASDALKALAEMGKRDEQNVQRIDKKHTTRQKGRLLAAEKLRHRVVGEANKNGVITSSSANSSKEKGSEVKETMENMTANLEASSSDEQTSTRRIVKKPAATVAGKRGKGKMRSSGTENVNDVNVSSLQGPKLTKKGRLTDLILFFPKSWTQETFETALQDVHEQAVAVQGTCSVESQTKVLFAFAAAAMCDASHFFKVALAKESTSGMCHDLLNAFGYSDVRQLEAFITEIYMPRVLAKGEVVQLVQSNGTRQLIDIVEIDDTKIDTSGGVSYLFDVYSADDTRWTVPLHELRCLQKNLKDISTDLHPFLLTNWTCKDQSEFENLFSLWLDFLVNGGSGADNKTVFRFLAYFECLPFLRPTLVTTTEPQNNEALKKLAGLKLASLEPEPEMDWVALNTSFGYYVNVLLAAGTEVEYLQHGSFPLRATIISQPVEGRTRFRIKLNAQDTPIEKEVEMDRIQLMDDGVQQMMNFLGV